MEKRPDVRNNTALCTAFEDWSRGQEHLFSYALQGSMGHPMSYTALELLLYLIRFAENRTQPDCL